MAYDLKIIVILVVVYWHLHDPLIETVIAVEYMVVVSFLTSVLLAAMWALIVAVTVDSLFEKLIVSNGISLLEDILNGIHFFHLTNDQIDTGLIRSFF